MSMTSRIGCVHVIVLVVVIGIHAYMRVAYVLMMRNLFYIQKKMADESAKMVKDTEDRQSKTITDLQELVVRTLFLTLSLPPLSLFLSLSPRLYLIRPFPSRSLAHSLGRLE